MQVNHIKIKIRHICFDGIQTRIFNCILNNVWSSRMTLLPLRSIKFWCFHALMIPVYYFYGFFSTTESFSGNRAFFAISNSGRVFYSIYIILSMFKVVLVFIAIELSFSIQSSAFSLSSSEDNKTIPSRITSSQSMFSISSWSSAVIRGRFLPFVNCNFF